jgi:alpha-N-arabinofuranosidase
MEKDMKDRDTTTTVYVHVNADKAAGRVDPFIYGQFLEHIFDSVVGGLHAEVLSDPSFEAAPCGSEGGRFASLARPGGQALDAVLGAPGAEGAALSWRGSWKLEEEAGASLLRQHGQHFGTECFFGPELDGDWKLGFELRRRIGLDGVNVLLGARGVTDFLSLRLGFEGNRTSALLAERQGAITILARGEACEVKDIAWTPVTVERKRGELVATLGGREVFRWKGELPAGRIGFGANGVMLDFRSIRLETADGAVQGFPGRMLGMHEVEASGASASWQAWSGPGAVADWHWTSAAGRGAANGDHAQAVTVRQAGASGAGIEQAGRGLERGGRYRLSLMLKSDIPVEAVLELEGREARVELVAGGRDWSRRECELSLPAGGEGLALGSFRLVARRPGAFIVDNVVLLPAALDPVLPLRKDIFEKVAGLEPSFIRWPGGCYAEFYRWEDGIGPREARRSRPNYTWGSIDPNNFGTDEFLRLCGRLGAEPVLVLNIGKHADAEDWRSYIEEGLRWIEYCNGGPETPEGARRAANGRREPWNVKYWEIDNESWFIGTDRYGMILNEWKRRIRERWPDLVFLATGPDNYDLLWPRRLLANSGEDIAYLSAHHYHGNVVSSPTDPIDEGDYHAGQADVVAFDAFFRAMGEILPPGTRVAETEWGRMAITVDAALYGARLMNSFERNAGVVGMACPALFIRKWGVTPFWNDALVNISATDSFVSPLWHAIRLWRRSWRPDALAASARRASEDGAPRYLPDLSAAALLDPADPGRAFHRAAVAREGEGDLVLRVVNPNLDRTLELVIEIEGGPGWRGAARASVLGNGDPTAYNFFDAPAKIAPRELPVPREGGRLLFRLAPASMAVIEIARD